MHYQVFLTSVAVTGFPREYREIMAERYAVNERGDLVFYDGTFFPQTMARFQANEWSHFVIVKDKVIEATIGEYRDNTGGAIEPLSQSEMDANNAFITSQKRKLQRKK